MTRIDRQGARETRVDKVSHLKAKLERVRAEVVRLSGNAEQFMDTPDGQISLTDPDARSMAARGKGTGWVGYIVQTVVDTNTHLIVAHEVTMVGNDRTQLAPMAKAAKAALQFDKLEVIADRGYFNGSQILTGD